MLSDTIVSFIRTGVPVVVGAVAAWIARQLGWVTPDTAALAQSLTVLVILGYYSLARFLEKKWSFFGYLLGVPKEPAYKGTPGAPTVTG
jgi:hypothetical protein